MELEEDWRVGYNDGSGREDGAAAAAFSEDRRGGENTLDGEYLGTMTSVADALREGAQMVPSSPGPAVI